MTYPGRSCDAPIEGAVDDVLIRSEALCYIVGGRKFSSPEKGRNEEDAKRCAGWNARDPGQGAGGSGLGRRCAVLEVGPQLLPKLRAVAGSRKRGEDESTGVLEIDSGVAT